MYKSQDSPLYNILKIRIFIISNPNVVFLSLKIDFVQTLINCRMMRHSIWCFIVWR